MVKAQTQRSKQRRTQDAAQCTGTGTGTGTGADGDEHVAVKQELASFADMLSALDGSSASYILGQQQQQTSVVPGGATSPTLSLSSGSGSSSSHAEYNGLSAPPSQHADSSPLSLLSLDLTSVSSHDQALMFPALGSTSFADSAYGGTAEAAALDGWLQQYVNVDAIDAAGSESVLAVDRSSPGLLYASPESPAEGSAELLDQTAVAAIAEALSSDVLASIMSGAPVDVGGELLPFATGLATPLANIAPQETISVEAAGLSRKRPRGVECSAAAAAVSAPTFAATAACAAAAGGETLAGSRRDAGATARASSASPQARSAAAGSARPLAPSPAGHMVRLAPRQSPPLAARPSGGARPGSHTPPGLSVLAKTAQHQAPMHVKAEAPARPQHAAIAPSSLAAQALRESPPAEAAVAQKRQERLIKNRAAALLSRKRKREYMSKLEGDVELLRESNEALARRLEEMERRLGAVTAERDMLRKGSAASAAAATLQPAPAPASSAGPAKKAKTERPAATSPPPPPSSPSPQQKAQASDCMAADGGSREKPGMPCLPAPPLPPLFAPARHASEAASPDKTHPLAARHHPIRPRVSMPAAAPKKPEQRAAGALLMAVLFSFSLFTLPSLYTPDSRLSTGGQQSAGIIPVLPPAGPPRLLLADKDESGSAPLIERVRRSISAMAQQIDAAQEGAQPDNRTHDAARRVRPMTMQESVGLRAWISHGLARTPGVVGRHDMPSSLAVVRPASAPPVADQPLSSSSSSSSLDYAMMYCPAMQHVMFGDVLGAAEAVDAAEPKASSRAISGSLDDVDDHVPGAQLAVSDGPARASSLELIPTQAGRLHAKSRPKMSFYSPVAIGGDDTADVGAPWEEYAKLADGPAQHLHRSQQRQKYLRIDVEVVGSRWVTADKFAQGLF